MNPKPADVQRLMRKILSFLELEVPLEVVISIVETMFHVPTETQESGNCFASQRKFAKTFIKMAADVTGSANAVCQTRFENPDPVSRVTERTMMRYFRDGSMHEMHARWRLVWFLLFRAMVCRYGLLRQGYDVYIDETQASFFGDAPDFETEAHAAKTQPGRYTEAALASGPSKDDSYSGRFRAHTYDVMVACFRRSQVILPLDVVLVATTGPDLPEEIRVPDRGRKTIMSRYLHLLSTVYPVPKLIMHDRGYHGTASFSMLTLYCKKHGCYYLSPARRDRTKVLVDGKRMSRDAFIKNYASKSKEVDGSPSERYLVAQVPIRLNRRKGKRLVELPRTLIVFLRPRKGRKKLPEGAVELDKWWAFGFYTNCHKPGKNIGHWARVYSERWRQEHVFAQRARFNHGFHHKMGRRYSLFCVGFLIVTIYMVFRAIRLPEYDKAKLRRYQNLPKFQSQLLDAISADTKY